MSTDEFIASILESYPRWSVSSKKYGDNDWVDTALDDGRFFTVEVRPSGEIGFSEILRNSGIDFGGHDEVFSDLDEVLNFIKIRKIL